MADMPDHRTSNYGWALWHLEQASTAFTPDEPGALYHAQAATARAMLAQAGVLGIPHGIDPNGDSTWTTPEHPNEQWRDGSWQ